MRMWRPVGDILRLGAIVALMIADTLLLNTLVRVKVHRIEENGLHSMYDMK